MAADEADPTRSKAPLAAAAAAIMAAGPGDSTRLAPGPLVARAAAAASAGGDGGGAAAAGAALPRLTARPAVGAAATQLSSALRGGRPTLVARAAAPGRFGVVGSGILAVLEFQGGVGLAVAVGEPLAGPGADGESGDNARLAFDGGEGFVCDAAEERLALPAPALWVFVKMRPGVLARLSEPAAAAAGLGACPPTAVPVLAHGLLALVGVRAGVFARW